MPIDATRYAVKCNPQTRFTRKGKPYLKTNLPKVIGAAGGAVCSSVMLIKDRKNLTEIFDGIINNLKENVQPDMLEKCAKRMQIAKIGGIAGAIATFTLAGLLLGAVAGGIVNAIRAHNANKLDINVDLEA